MNFERIFIYEAEYHINNLVNRVISKNNLPFNFDLLSYFNSFALGIERYHRNTQKIYRYIFFLNCCKALFSF